MKRPLRRRGTARQAHRRRSPPISTPALAGGTKQLGRIPINCQTCPEISGAEGISAADSLPHNPASALWAFNSPPAVALIAPERGCVNLSLKSEGPGIQTAAGNGLKHPLPLHPTPHPVARTAAMGDQPTAMDVENDDRDPEPVAADSLPSSSEADDADDSLQGACPAQTSPAPDAKSMPTIRMHTAPLNRATHADGEDSGPSLEADDDLDSPTTSAPAAAESNAPASTSTTSGAPSRPPGPGGRSALRTVVPPLIPLGKRPAPSSSHPAAPAAAATAPTSASQPAAKVKRARRTQRCGKCAPCLNPHWKKACLEVRREEDPQRAAPAPKKPVEAEDPFVRTLRTIMAPSGGITQTKHVRILLDLMKRAGSLAQRSALLQVLQNSTPEVQELAVQQRLLLLLQSWLAPAIDGNKPKNATRIVECLATLPVTIPALQPPCELGKLVGKLRRAEGFEIAHLPARQLVAKWKALIEQAASSRLVQLASPLHACMPLSCNCMPAA